MCPDLSYDGPGVSNRAEAVAEYEELIFEGSAIDAEIRESKFQA